MCLNHHKLTCYKNPVLYVHLLQIIIIVKLLNLGRIYTSEGYNMHVVHIKYYKSYH